MALCAGPVLSHADGDDDNDTPKLANRAAAELSLSAAQQQAVGIRLEQPLALRGAPPIEAFGTVLDPVALVSDLGKLESTRAAALAAAAESARLGRLYRENQQASLKSLQAATAQAAEADAQAHAAALNFALQWGPLAGLSAERQHALIETLTQGHTLLLRADVPARHLGGEVAPRAAVEIDGVNISARVLGALPRTDAAAQSAGWLLQLERPPPGLGPGARAAVHLQAGAVAGLLVPPEALVYGEQGAYVYRRQAGGAAETFKYEPVAVRPVTRVGNAWLVEGLKVSDQVVVQGAGVLWSLQGIGSFSAAEEEHD